VNTVSTHVLDTALGRPAHGISVTLERDGREVGSGVTDSEGRVRDLVSSDALQLEGKATYRLTFLVADYFSRDERESFYTEIVVSFHVTGGAAHYHVPLLLSPFGYSTYRGS
jgi:5-hydroxyisourate hydrolase